MLSSLDTLPSQAADLNLISTIRNLPEANRLCFIGSLDKSILQSEIKTPVDFRELINLITKRERLIFLQCHANDFITDGVVLSSLHCHLDQSDYVQLLHQEYIKIKNGYELTMILATLHKSDCEKFIPLIIPKIPTLIVEYDEFVLVMNKIKAIFTHPKTLSRFSLMTPYHAWREVEPTFETIKSMFTQSLRETWFSNNVTTFKQFEEIKTYLTPALVKHWMHTAPVANLFVKPLSSPGM
jgi:hypothetical protein